MTEQKAPESWTVTFLRGERISVWSRWWRRTEGWHEQSRVTDQHHVTVTYGRVDSRAKVRT